jgi:hypothetical protein
MRGRAQTASLRECESERRPTHVDFETFVALPSFHRLLNSVVHLAGSRFFLFFTGSHRRHDRRAPACTRRCIDIKRPHTASPRNRAGRARGQTTGHALTVARGPARAIADAPAGTCRTGSHRRSGPGGARPCHAPARASHAGRKTWPCLRSYQCLRASAHIARLLQGPRMLVIAFMRPPAVGTTARAASRSEDQPRVDARAACGSAPASAAIAQAVADSGQAARLAPEGRRRRSGIATGRSRHALAQPGHAQLRAAQRCLRAARSRPGSSRCARATRTLACSKTSRSIARHCTARADRRCRCTDVGFSPARRARSVAATDGRTDRVTETSSRRSQPQSAATGRTTASAVAQHCAPPERCMVVSRRAALLPRAHASRDPQVRKRQRTDLPAATATLHRHRRGRSAARHAATPPRDEQAVAVVVLPAVDWAQGGPWSGLCSFALLQRNCLRCLVDLRNAR